MKKKLVSMLIAAAMAASILSGCGGNSENADVTEENAQSAVAEDVVSDENAEESDAAAADNGEVTEIVVGIMSMGTVDSSVQDRIEAAVNEKMEDLIHVKADIQWFDANSYITQIPMMISAGEQLDAIMFTPIPMVGYSGFMSQNQLMDISEYLDEYGSDIKAVLGEEGLAATSKDGVIYGVPANLSRSSGMIIGMRADVLEELGMREQFDNMTNWTEFEEILTAAKDAGYTGMINCSSDGNVIELPPYVTGPENFADTYWVDTVGDANYQVYVDPEDDTVKCYYMNEDYKESLLRAGDWYDKGLLYRDAATSEDYGFTQMKNKVGVACLSAADYGFEETFDTSCGTEMATKYILFAKCSTTSYTKFGYAVPVTAQEPEAAVKFINLLYSSNEVHDTLCWGEEGVDWVKTDMGTAKFPEGVTADNVGYHENDFQFGDILSCTPWGDDPELYVKTKAANDQVENSKYTGFAIDSTNVANQVTACQNVCNEYVPSLSSGIHGAAGTEAKYEEFIAALEAAGINDIIAEYQSQLDAWLAEQ